MFSGTNNPWTFTTPANRGQRPQQQFNPLSQQATQPPQGFQPPQVQWPQQTPDMNYANQLAQHYAMQMPNQQVPGSAPLPTFQPPQQGLPTPQPQMPGQQGDWRDAFKAAKMDWRMAQPGRDMHGTDAWSQWRNARPDRGQFRGFGGQ